MDRQRAEQQSNRVSIPRNGRKFSLCHFPIFLSGPKTHQSSYAVGIGGNLPRGKAVEAWSWRHIFI